MCYLQLTFPSFPLAFCSVGCFVVEEEEEGGGSLISVPTSGGDCLRGLMRERGEEEERKRGEGEGRGRAVH